MSIARISFATAVRPFSTAKKRANRKNKPAMNYDTIFVAIIPIATDK